MRDRSYFHGGVTTSCYCFSKGQKLKRHNHPLPHTITVLQGACVVEIYDGRLIYMTGDTDTLELPAEIDHEIMAAQDNTIFIASIVGAYVRDPNLFGRALDDGGVLMVDGTKE